MASSLYFSNRPCTAVRAEQFRSRYAEPMIALVSQDRTAAATALARTGQGKRRVDAAKRLIAGLTA